MARAATVLEKVNDASLLPLSASYSFCFRISMGIRNNAMGPTMRMANRLCQSDSSTLWGVAP